MNAPYFVTKSHKSVGLAILLTFLFGPIGLLYASVTGGLLMIFAPIVLGFLAIAGLFQEDFLLLGWSFGLLFLFAISSWLISIIWAVISVNSYNDEVDYEAKKQYELWNQFGQKDQNQVVINISQKELDKRSSGQRKIGPSGKPSLQDWLKDNPRKSINDYYAKFGTQN